MALEQRAEAGLPTKLVDDMPQISSAAAPFWQAFEELSSQRIGGMSVGAIRREAVTDWLDEAGIDDPSDRSEYRFYLGVLDSEFLAQANKPAEVK